MAQLEALKQVEIFLDLTDKELAAVVRRAQQKEYKPEAVIVKERMPGGVLHVILEGSVEVRKKTSGGADKPLAVLESGSVFGEMSLFDDHPYSASVVARENTSILMLEKDKFLSLAQSDPNVVLKITINLINTLASRLRKTNDNLVAYAMLSRPSASPGGEDQ